MKAIRLIFVATSCLLVICATSRGQDQNGAPSAVEKQTSLIATTPSARSGKDKKAATAPVLLKTLPINLRNRGLTSVGGPAAKFKNAVAINGTRMKR